MAKKIEAQRINNKDVIIAFDLKSANYNVDNIKLLLNTFDAMVKDYNYNGRVILFDEVIQMEFNIDDMDSLNNFVLQESNGNSNYECVTQYAKDKCSIDDWDIFCVYCITDGKGTLPKDNYNDSFIWVVGNLDLEFPFGSII